MATPVAIPIQRHNRLFVAIIAATVLLAAFIAWDSKLARAISAPQVFTVAQSPAGPAQVAPGDLVTYSIDFTAHATVGVADPYITGTLSAGLTVTSFTPFYAAVCSGVGTAQFSCHLGSISPNITILQLVVTATVANAVDGTVVDLALTNFGAKDSFFDAFAVLPTGTDPGALTIRNESLTVTNTPSLASIFEAGLVTFTTGITNSGSGSSGAYDSVMTLSGGTVDNVVCPGGAGGTGTGTTTATCASNASLASLGNATMLVTGKAADGSGVGTLSANVTLSPAAGNVTGTPPGIQYVPPATVNVTVSELTLTTAGSYTTGATALVCTTNNPLATALLKGYTSNANPLTTGDYQTVASGGAVVAGLGLGACPAGQQGISFTSVTAGTVAVTARTNGFGSGAFGASNTVTVTFSSAAVPNPVPVLTSIAPLTAGAGGPSFPLVVGGSNFVAGSIVRWNGADLATAFGSSVALSATVPAANILSAGSATVTVFNPAPGGGSSAGQTFTITSAPAITSLTPSSVTAGSAGFPMVIGGSNFVAGSVARWNGVDLATTFGSPVAITAQVPTGNIATPGTASVTVFNPGAGGGLSNALTFTTTTNATKLGFTAQPASGIAGAAFPVQPVVAVQTSAGDTVTTDNSTVVTLALTGAGTLTCTGGLSKTVTAGVATFSGCSVAAPGSYVIRATSSPVLAQADTSTFVVASTATKLGFTAQPSNGVVATALPTQPVVAVQDAGGATVTADNTTVVTLALTTGTGTLTCTGGLSKTAVAGVATFAGCAVSAAGTGDKLTATSAPALTAAQSATFDVVAAAPTSSAQLVVGTPAAGVKIARSRLSFSATTGSLAAPTSVTFVIKRKSDNKYWNGASGQWETEIAENQATSGATSWTFSITGEDRREFAGTTVIIEARAVSGGVTYISALTPEIAIR